MNYQIESLQKINEYQQGDETPYSYVYRNSNDKQNEVNNFNPNSFISPVKNVKINQSNDQKNNQKKQKSYNISLSDKKQHNDIKSLDQLLFEQNVNKIRQSQANYKNMISNISSEYGNYKQNTQQELKNSKKEIQQLNHQMTQQSDDLESQNIQLKAQMKSLNDDIEYQKNKFNELQQQKQKLIQIVEDIQQQNKTQQEEKRRADISHYQQKSAFELKLKKIESQLLISNQKIIHIELDKRDLQQKFLNASRGIQDDVVKDLEDSVQKIDIENSMLKNEIFDLKMKVNEKNRKIEQLEFRINSEQTQQDTLQKQIESLNKKITEYQIEYVQKDQKILNLINQNQRINQNEQQQQEQIQKLQDYIMNSDKEISILRKQLVEKTAQQESLDQDNMKQIQEENEQLKLETNQKKKCVQVLLEEIDRLKKQLPGSMGSQYNNQSSNQQFNNDTYNYHTQMAFSPIKSTQNESPLRNMPNNKSTPNRNNLSTQYFQTSDTSGLQSLYINTHSKIINSPLTNINQYQDPQKVDSDEIMRNIKISRSPISEFNNENLTKSKVQDNDTEKQIINELLQSEDQQPLVQEVNDNNSPNNITEDDKKQIIKELTQVQNKSQINEDLKNQNEDQNKSEEPLQTSQQQNSSENNYPHNQEDIQPMKQEASYNQYSGIFIPKVNELNVVVQEIQETPQDQEQSSRVSTLRQQEQKRLYPNNLESFSNQIEEIDSNNEKYEEQQQKQATCLTPNPIKRSIHQQEQNIPKHKLSQSLTPEEQERINLIKQKRQSQIDELNQALSFKKDDKKQKEEQCKSVVLDNLINKNDNLYKKLKDNIVKAASMYNIHSDSSIGSTNNLHASMNLNKSQSKGALHKESPKRQLNRNNSNNEEHESSFVIENDIDGNQIVVQQNKQVQFKDQNSERNIQFEQMSDIHKHDSQNNSKIYSSDKLDNDQQISQEPTISQSDQN